MTKVEVPLGVTTEVFWAAGVADDPPPQPSAVNNRSCSRKSFKKKIHVNPFNCSEELSGILGHYRSFHYGDYRVVYRVFEDIRVVSVVGLGRKNTDHRTDLYTRLEGLAKRGRLAQAVLETYRAISPEKS
jgi:mRNA-degrading endonuclease RelE of RelBE toxin-antitoxin system